MLDLAEEGNAFLKPRPRVDVSEDSASVVCDDSGLVASKSELSLAKKKVQIAALRKAKVAKASLSSAVCAAAVAARRRRLAGLFQHYYPEGDWGYVIVACAVLVTAIAHGLQLSFGVLTVFIWRRWKSAGLGLEDGRQLELLLATGECMQMLFFSANRTMSVAPRLFTTFVGKCKALPRTGKSVRRRAVKASIEAADKTCLRKCHLGYKAA
jgi:hypothetical protein